LNPAGPADLDDRKYVYFRTEPLSTAQEHCPAALSIQAILPPDADECNTQSVSRVHVSNAANAARAGKDTLIKIGWWNPSSSIAAYTTATDLVESGRAASQPDGTDQCNRATTAAAK